MDKFYSSRWEIGASFLCPVYLKENIYTEKYLPPLNLSVFGLCVGTWSPNVVILHVEMIT